MVNFLKPKTAEEEALILKFLQTGERPPEVSDDRLRRWKKHFTVCDGELHSLKAVDGNGELLPNSRIFLPWKLDDYFKRFHDEKEHPGRDALINKLKERYISVPRGWDLLFFCTSRSSLLICRKGYGKAKGMLCLRSEKDFAKEACW